MDRSPQIEKTLDLMSEAMGGSRSPGKCAACPREFDPKEEFSDALSRKEYGISNLCQQCQNSVFSEDEPEVVEGSDLPDKADPATEMGAILAAEWSEPAVPRLGWSTWGAYSTETHEDDTCDGPAEVVMLPYSSCVVADIDDWVSAINIPRADAVVKTDRGTQWVYLDKSQVAKDRDFLLSSMDFQHAMFSRDRGAWNMRVRSKQSPNLPRRMIGITDAGKSLASAWNEIADKLAVLPKDFQHPELPPAPTSILAGGRHNRCKPVTFDVHQKLTGKSGATWIIPASGRFPASDIHCRDAKREHSEGYYGSTLTWTLEDGSTCSLQGPWHSNAGALYDDTGVDLRECHQTWCAVSRNVRFMRSGAIELIDPIYADEEVQESSFSRGDQIGQRIADERREPVYLVRESGGGGCYGWVCPTLRVRAAGITVLEGSWWPVAADEVLDCWQRWPSAVPADRSVIIRTRSVLEDERKRALAHTILTVDDSDVFQILKHPDPSLVGWKGSFAGLDDILNGKPQPRSDLPEVRS